MDPLSMWFMAVVVGSLLTIQWQLHEIGKKIDPKANRRKTRDDDPGKRFENESADFPRTTPSKESERT